MVKKSGYNVNILEKFDEGRIYRCIKPLIEELNINFGACKPELFIQ